MELKDFLDKVDNREMIVWGTEEYKFMANISQEAMKITCKLNNSYNTPEQIISLFSELTGRMIDENFGLFPPFYTDFGKNIKLGKNVFINSGCQFQDQGGIYIGDYSLIGPKTVLATLNHCFAPEDRGSLIPAPIRIGKCVWIGANVTIVPGITIGDNAIIGAGAVVTKDVPENTIYAGVPAKQIGII